MFARLPHTPPSPRNTLLLGHGSQETQSQAARAARPGWPRGSSAATAHAARPAGKVRTGASRSPHSLPGPGAEGNPLPPPPRSPAASPDPCGWRWRWASGTLDLGSGYHPPSHAGFRKYGRRESVSRPHRLALPALARSTQDAACSLGCGRYRESHRGDLARRRRRRFLPPPRPQAR